MAGGLEGDEGTYVGGDLLVSVGSSPSQIFGKLLTSFTFCKVIPI